MIKRIIIVYISMTLFSDCQKNPTSPTTLSDDRPLIGTNDLTKISVSIVDYDVIHILHQFGFNLRSPNIVRIAVGSKNLSGFRQLRNTMSLYDTAAKCYIIHFDFTVKMDSSKIIAPLTIRYFFVDSTFVDADTSIALYKYPYPNTEIIADSSILIAGEPFQDVARVGSKLYYHPIGPWGLFEYDLNTKIKRELYGYSSGDHIAADSNFVFCDVNSEGNIIVRFNTLSDLADMRIPFDINYGMSIYRHLLYVATICSQHYAIRTYTLDGTPVDTIAYPNVGYYLAIYDSVAYSVLEISLGQVNQLLRFDLRTKQYLPRVYSPAFSCVGIKSFGDKLYFCDYFKKYIGAVPVSDLASIDLKKQITTCLHRAPNQALKLTE